MAAKKRSIIVENTSMRRSACMHHVCALSATASFEVRPRDLQTTCVKSMQAV